MGLKVSDALTMPVCDGPFDPCHRDIHASKDLQQLQPEWIELTLRAGVIEFEGAMRDELADALEFVRSKNGAR